MSGIVDPNSGGTTLFVAPGLQYATQRWIVEAVVQFPVVQDKRTITGPTDKQSDFDPRVPPTSQHKFGFGPNALAPPGWRGR